MNLIHPKHQILSDINGDIILNNIEAAGRTCYKSEARISPETSHPFIRKIITLGHESVIEHESVSIRFICDRGVSHELVRHRLAAYSQESTRYCNYSGGVAFIIPPWVNIQEGVYISLSELKEIDEGSSVWFQSMLDAEKTYSKLIDQSWSPQQARSVLPNSLKTEIVMTANLREWRHIFQLRTSKNAHPQMQQLMLPLLKEFKQRIPVIFDDINITVALPSTSPS